MFTNIKLFKGDRNPSGPSITFMRSGEYSTEEGYEQVNKKINDYADENGLIIQDVQYWTTDKYVYANVLFSEVPKEVWL